MSIYDKDSVCKLSSQCLDLVLSEREGNVSTSHPKFFSWLNSLKTDVNSFAKVLEVFDVSHPEIGSSFSEIIREKAIVAKGVEAEVIVSSMLSSIRPRLLQKQFREKYRQVKSVCNVGMRSIYVLGENGYDSYPETMNSLIRYSSSESINYDKYNDYCKDFVSSGLIELSGLVKRWLGRIKDSEQNDLWLGFHRVKPDVCAAILAKFHNFEWSDFNYLTCSLGRLPDFICEPEVVEKKDCEKTASGFLKEIMTFNKSDYRFINLSYQPKLYPLRDFNNIPKNVSKIISHVEKMPELGNLPGFDYLWVLVPGFSLSHPGILHSDGFYRIMLDGKVVESKSEIEVSSKLDKELVQQEILIPCLLGERDGKCYFLSPWY